MRKEVEERLRGQFGGYFEGLQKLQEKERLRYEQEKQAQKILSAVAKILKLGLKVDYYQTKEGFQIFENLDDNFDFCYIPYKDSKSYQETPAMYQLHKAIKEIPYSQEVLKQIKDFLSKEKGFKKCKYLTDNTLQVEFKKVSNQK